MLKKKLTSETLIKVPFYDVDQMRIVWHGNYFKYFERARCDLLDKFDYGYTNMADSGYGWPVIDSRIKFIKPAMFDKTIVVQAELLEYQNRLKIGYQINDLETGTRLTRGHSVQVAVDLATEEMCYISPQVLLDKLSCHGYL